MITLYGVKVKTNNEYKEIEIMYLKATILTIAGWFIGMVLDANIDFGDPMGFLSLRILFPILAMGLCILHELRRGSSR